MATYYLVVNRNKRSVALDLKDPEDPRWPAARPARRRPDRELPAGGLDRFGLGYEAVAAGNPGLIYPPSAASARPRAALPGYDLIVQAMSGLMSLTGGPEGAPFRAGISVFDVMAGLHATIGILAALHAPRRDRAGQQSR